MTRAEIEYRIKCLNDEMFLDSPFELITLRNSPDYTYNKAIALVEKILIRNVGTLLIIKIALRLGKMLTCF